MTEKWERMGSRIIGLDASGGILWFADVKTLARNENEAEQHMCAAVAKLMQAAPEMLAELKKLLTEWDAAGLKSQQSERIRALLQTTEQPR